MKKASLKRAKAKSVAGHDEPICPRRAAQSAAIDRHYHAEQADRAPKASHRKHNQQHRQKGKINVEPTNAPTVLRA
jgi:hypothetical protein